MITKTEQNEIQDYLKDASNTTGFCNSVVFPENTEEIVSILKRANSEKISVTICGNKTGLAGGSVPLGGIVLLTEKLNKILEINEKDMIAVVEPGVILADFLNELKPKKLYYPPDPTELNCFLGGTVATNASGSKTFKYGSTREFVIGLEIILATGEKLNLERGQNFATGNKLNTQRVDGPGESAKLFEFFGLGIQDFNQCFKLLLVHSRLDRETFYLPVFQVRREHAYKRILLLNSIIIHLEFIFGY